MRFEGPKDRDELVAYYRDADVFVLPSRSEPWGMVLNEAAAAGLPLVATEESGAAHDLIEEGVNGFRVPAGDVAALRDRLTRLADDPGVPRECGARSRELARGFTPEAWAEGVARLASELSATAGSRRRPSAAGAPTSCRVRELIGRASEAPDPARAHVRELTLAVGARREDDRVGHAVAADELPRLGGAPRSA